MDIVLLILLAVLVVSIVANWVLDFKIKKLKKEQEQLKKELDELKKK
ncbi:hypothetical protein HYH11_01910 [Lactobacillus salivarius]|nr:hypothetical protein [Ligilactobacillus salivarius]NXZ96748.1 hypothetical protein [Ligilactobacillus salivarius]NYA62032.1 hypothetical protein [Ligilactobacillus salivarius]NYA69238.1 hypothetical protein [Ligilactobacillus salivarius]NYA73160.1 hypothetical protein [Ligilactobacillus salivarius]